MHFPEEQLTTYLRVFLPPGRIDHVLDQIAEAAIENEVEDEIELFSLAHWLMDADDRRTDELEAAVLVEEVGLSPREAAIILGLDVAHVETAVATAWADLSPTAQDEARVEEPRGEEPPAEEALAHEPPGEGSPDDGQAEPAAAVEEAADEGSDVPRRRPSAGWWALAIAVVLLAVLAVATFSAAGQARLNAVGIDPLVAFVVVVGFIGGGAALVKAGSAAPPADPVPSRSDPSDAPAAPSPR